jgi:hypothetical protein
MGASAPLRDGVRATLVRFNKALDDGLKVADLVAFPEFALLRALAIEAYYSDFRQSGYRGPTAWDVTGYRSAPTAAATAQDWSFLTAFNESAGPAEVLT